MNTLHGDFVRSPYQVKKERVKKGSNNSDSSANSINEDIMQYASIEDGADAFEHVSVFSSHYIRGFFM